MFKIEKSVPVPAGPGRKNSVEFPFAAMKVGDSFLVKVGGKGADAGRTTLWRHMKRFEEDNSAVRLIARSVRGGVRVWRTA